MIKDFDRSQQEGGLLKSLNKFSVKSQIFQIFLFKIPDKESTLKIFWSNFSIISFFSVCVFFPIFFMHTKKNTKLLKF